jgi:hypothetical protein
MDDNNNDSIILDVSNGSLRSDGKQRYFCSYCNTRLTPFTQEDMKGAYLCTKCTIEYWPKLSSVKKANKFDLPGPNTNDHGDIIGDKTIPITTIDDPNKEMSSTSYSSQRLAPSFEALKKQGYRITSYEER